MTDPKAGDGYTDYDNEGEYLDDSERECFHCAGEGLVECRDPIQCTRRHTRSGMCFCGSCNGSGLAKDMTIW